VAGSRENPVRLPPERRLAVRPDGAGSAAAGELPARDDALLERLKQWRRRRADADGVPAYVICNDATLAAIAVARPVSSDALIAVDGIGPAKLRRYGVQILTEIRDHGADERVPQHLRREPAELGDASSGQPVLYDQLRAWRRRRSVADGVKLWEVCSNDALLAVIGATPGTVAELAALGVLDQVRIDRYGEEIMREVRSYIASMEGDLPGNDRRDHGADERAP
jgi:ATP-dependent DNA helicase RecQ